MHDGHPWQVRISAPAHPHESVGSGVLIGPRHVITCASVVGAALGVAVGPEPPGGEVALELPLLPIPYRGSGTLVAWVPEAGWDPRWNPPGARPPGLAVLQLGEPAPATAIPARLEPIAPSHYRNRAVFCLGFPPDSPAGRRVHADCANADAETITGLETDHGTIERSFTGTGAWDPIRESVLGLVVADEFPSALALLIPAHCLLAVWPDAPVRADRGTGARLLGWVAGLDTRRGNLLLRLFAGLAFAGLGLVWWLEPDTQPALEQAPSVAATSLISGFVWEPTGKPIPGVRVLVPARGVAAETDRFGHFSLRFQEAAGAAVEVVVMAPGYQSLTEPARIGESGLNLVLRRPEPSDGAPAETGDGLEGSPHVGYPDGQRP
ncbi:trypsin-like peptidase domain-containing protein [Candidatus Thiodictyon syntrophicum]|jgi:hypothetical protein|uniref:Uncharacterized protein n=1 Tax=Candidatus Thiodictyon syntrophicum TaxID=1166950 RepID=A0A2K8U720_9GAMM|nr:trypsin-like peptidase domain-containing protein [Candidatus Thiodictyon syntrophicum]AUB81390.1 hypothetical protein THSYN_10780 [Candidatus Thiodictyon syntrophicum]